MYMYVHNLQTDIKDAQKRFKENSWGYLTDKNKFEVAFMNDFSEYFYFRKDNLIY